MAVLAGAIMSIGLSSCSGSEDGGTGNMVAPHANAIAPEPPAPAAPASGTTIKRTDDALEFEYAWPASAVAIAPLNDWLKSHADSRYAEAHEQAERDRKSMEKDGFAFRAYGYQQKWSVVADTPEVLVMQSEGYSYTGGAHGMPFTTTLIWDREAGKRRATDDLIDVSKLASVKRDAFCKELDRQRAEKRGEPVKSAAEDSFASFNSCVDMKTQEIIPISNGGKALDAVRVVIGPYEAGRS
ncbi:MAG: DUF4163 domain-containing protein, partial [Sphingobium sp.]